MYLRDSKFVINCAARTGSTYFVHLLRSNPEILCHGEVIDLKGVGQLAGEYIRKRTEIEGYEQALHQKLVERPERFIYDHIFDTQGFRVVGFKYKTDESFDPAYREYTDVLVSDKDIKVLHLRRRNLLHQYISHQVVLDQTGITFLNRGDARPMMQPFSREIAHVIAYFDDVADREQRSLDMYSGHRSLTVDYEDLLGAQSDSHAKVQDFLGVHACRLTSNTMKIIPDNDSLLSNREEIEDALRSAGYAHRIE